MSVEGALSIAACVLIIFAFVAEFFLSVRGSATKLHDINDRMRELDVYETGKLDTTPLEGAMLIAAREKLMREITVVRTVVDTAFMAAIVFALTSAVYVSTSMVVKSVG